MIKETRLLLKLSVVFCIISLVCVSCRKADLPTKESVRQLPSIEQKFFNTHKSLEPKINAIAEYVKRLNDKKNILELTVQRIGYPRWDKAFKLSSTSNSVAIRSTSTGTSNGVNTPAQNYDIYSIPFVRDSQNYVNASMIVRTSPSDTSISYICDWQYRKKPHGSASSNTTAENHAMFFMMMSNRVFGHKEFDITDPDLFPGKTKEPGKKRIGIVNKKSGSNLPIKSQDLVLIETCNEYYICTSPDYCNQHGGCDYLACINGSSCYPVATICWRSWSDAGGGSGTGWGLPGSGSGDNGTGGGTGGNTPPPGSELPPVPCEGPPSQSSLPGSTIQIKLQNEPCSSNPGWTPSLYPELDNTIEPAMSTAYKELYYKLEQSYMSRPADAYTNMSRDEFIILLRDNPQLAASIDPITILVKIGVNAAADVLIQVFLLKLTDPSVNTWSDAISKVDWWQVSSTALTSLIPWRTPQGKVVIAAINGATSVFSDLHANGFISWEKTGIQFMEGFCSSFIANSLTDVIAKFGSVANFAKALVIKSGVHYSVICRWLGAGLKFVTKSYINPTTGQNVVLKRVMEGWEPKKIVVIGRTQEQRVKFFANQLKNELGNDYTIVTFKTDPNWSSAETLLHNKNFIRFHKERGYTFYDIGLDDFFPLTGNDMQDYGPYYLMEIMEVFNGK